MPILFPTLGVVHPRVDPWVVQVTSTPGLPFAVRAVVVQVILRSHERLVLLLGDSTHACLCVVEQPVVDAYEREHRRRITSGLRGMVVGVEGETTRVLRSSLGRYGWQTENREGETTILVALRLVPVDYAQRDDHPVLIDAHQ